MDRLLRHYGSRLPLFTFGGHLMKLFHAPSGLSTKGHRYNSFFAIDIVSVEMFLLCSVQYKL